MQDSLNKILVGSAFFLVTCVVAVIGYWLAGWSLLEAVYMVTITIYGVGYGEVRPIKDPSLQIFTIFVIVAGCTSAIYVLGGFVQMIAEGEINRALGARRMTRDIDKLKDHVIVCGFGRVGRIVAGDLRDNDCPFVVIESSPERATEAERLGYLVRTGDAADENVLQSVGIAHARTLAAVLSDDAQNVFVTLSAKDLNPNVTVIARGESPSTERKLIHSGAERVVLPAAIGASLIAQIITESSAEAQLANESMGRQLNEQLHGVGLTFTEIAIGEQSPLAGHPLEDVIIEVPGGCVVVAVRKSDETVVRNPPADFRLESGSTLVLLSHSEATPEPILKTGTDHRIVYRGVRA